MRHDLRFALVRNGLQLPTVVAWSERLAVASPNEPMQGHLALTGRQGCVRRRAACQPAWPDGWLSCRV